MTLEELETAIDAYLPELQDDQSSLPHVSLAIAAGHRRLSRDHPREYSETVTSNPADVPAGWDDEFSEILEANWPALHLTDGVVQKFPVPFTVDVKVGARTRQIRFGSSPVSATNVAHVIFSGLWKLADIATLPFALEEPLKAICAAIYADILAGFFEASVSPSQGGVQLMDAGAKADGYRAQGRALRVAYAEMLGIDVADEDEPE